jgi:DNA-binding NtrC family response regulator
LAKGPHEIAPSAMKILMEYAWENNIDELEATLESAVACTPRHSIDETLLPTRVRYATLKAIPNNGIDLPHLVDEIRTRLIETALAPDQWQSNQSFTASWPSSPDSEYEVERFAEQNQEIKIKGH